MALIRCAAEVQLTITEYDGLKAWINAELAKPEKTIPQAAQDLILRVLNDGDFRINQLKREARHKGPQYR